MNSDLNNLLRERFHGHEYPVDPSAWYAIQGKLAGAAAVTDPLNEMLRDKFHGHQVKVDLSAWANISSQLGHAVPSSWLSTWGWASAGIVALAVGSAVYFSDSKPVATTAEIPTEITLQTTPGPGKERIIEPTVSTPATTVAEVNTTIGANSPVPATSTVQNVQPSISNSTAPRSNTPTAILATVNEAVADNESTNANEGEVIVAAILKGLREKAAQAIHNEQKVEIPETSVFAPIPEVPSPEISSPAVNTPIPATVLAPLPKLFIPNTFTPNGDGINDAFEVGAEGFERVKIRIISAKDNTQVFSSNIGGSWDGANCQEGYYFVAIEAITADGRVVSGSEMVWLNRNRLN